MDKQLPQPSTQRIADGINKHLIPALQKQPKPDAKVKDPNKCKTT